MADAQRFDPDLQKALADLLHANRDYVEAYAGWSRQPDERKMLHRGPLEDAALRIDEARRKATLRGPGEQPRG